MKNLYIPPALKLSSVFKMSALCIFFTGAVMAGSAQTWINGSSGVWLTAANWSPVGAPSGTAAAAVFNASTTGTIGINMNGISVANSSIGSIEFTGSTNSKTINNSSSVTPGIITLNGTTINSVPNTILSNSTSATQTITNGATQSLGIALGNATNNIISTEGTGGITITSVISGANPLTKAGAGTGALTLNGANTYTGSTTINSGTLSISSITNGGLASGIGASSAAAGNLVLNGGTLLYTGLTASTDRNFTLADGTSSAINVSANTLTLSGAAAPSTGSLTKSGAGILVLTGANLYSGTTTVSAGTLQLNKLLGNTLPTTNNITVSGGTLQISSNQTVNNIDLSSGTITVDAGSILTVNGTMTISGNGTITGTIVYGPAGSLIYSTGAAKTTGAEWPLTGFPYNLTLNTAGTNITLNENKTIGNNLTINSTAILTGTGFSLTVPGDWNAASAGAYNGGTNAASAVILNGAGSRTFTHTGGATFRNLTFSGTGNYTVNNDITISQNTLTISGCTVNTGSSSLSGSGALTMTGGILQLGKLNTTLPELSGIYTLNGGSIELNGAGNQVLRGARTYVNLDFSNSGTKTLTLSPTAVSGTITIADAAILDVNTNTMGGTGTNLTMTGTSKYKTAGTGTKPDAQGIYTLGTGTTIDFANGAGTQQDIRLTLTYGNIDISGSNVGLSGTSSAVSLQSGTTFTIKSGGTFNVRNINGFNGANNTAVNSTNAPSVVLEPNSTVNYNGTTNQDISNLMAYQNLSISGSGTKAAPSTISIKGNFTKSGTSLFDPNNGMVSFDGTGIQTYTATDSMDFYKVTLNNTVGGVTISSGGMGVKYLLTLSNDAKLIFGAGHITLRSTLNDGTASMDKIPASASITYPGAGRFRVERYISFPRKWQFISVPTDGTQSFKEAWQEGATLAAQNPVPGYGMQITQGAPGIGLGFDGTSPGGPTIKVFNAASGTYTGITNTTDPIKTTQGYMTYVRGDRLSLATFPSLITNPTTLRTEGKLYTGDQTIIPVAANRFISIGNPFASALDLRNITNTGLIGSEPGKATFYIWDPSLTMGTSYGLGGFQTLTYNNGNYEITPGGGSIYNGLTIWNRIESGQAFFVQGDSATGGGTLTFTEAAKTTGSTLAARSADMTKTLCANLFALPGGNPALVDGLRVYFNNDFSNGADGMDAVKIANTAENTGMRSNGKIFAVEYRKIPTPADTLFINTANLRVQSYEWQLNAANLTAYGLAAYVNDRYTGTETALNLNGSTTINFDVINNAGSLAADRFYISFKQVTVLAASLTGISASRNTDGTVSVKWNVVNEVNTDKYQTEHSKDGRTFSIIHSDNANVNTTGQTSYAYNDVQASKNENYYRIKVLNDNGASHFSAVAKVNATEQEGAISVNPNPVANKTIHLQLVNLTAGKYTVQVINSKGQTIYNGNLQVNRNSQVQQIQLADKTAAGKYELLLSNNAGEKKHFPVYILN